MRYDTDLVYDTDISVSRPVRGTIKGLAFVSKNRRRATLPVARRLNAGMASGLALLNNAEAFVESLDDEVAVVLVDAERGFDADGVGGHAAAADE